jgi:peptidoglycan hydrolase-like protein with peptidoglycan-binding domain
MAIRFAAIATLALTLAAAELSPAFAQQSIQDKAREGLNTLDRKDDGLDWLRALPVESETEATRQTGSTATERTYGLQPLAGGQDSNGLGRFFGTAEAGDEAQRRANTASSSENESPSKEAFRKRVANIQSRLQEFGYDPGPVNGQMGPRTHAAIRLFQNDHDLPENGKASEELWARIRVIIPTLGRLTRRLRQTAADDKSNTVRDPTTDIGGNGSGQQTLGAAAIKEIQQRLLSKGFDPGPLDGQMGRRTGNAIAAYQRDRGLTATGRPSNPLLSHLRADKDKAVAKQKGDRFTGSRTQTYSDGVRYDGQWRDGLFHGRGELAWQDGHRYIGNFKDGERTGRGEHVWPDGNR